MISFPLSDHESFIVLKNIKKLEKSNAKFKLPFNDFETARLLYDKMKFLSFVSQTILMLENLKLYQIMKVYLMKLKKSQKNLF